MNITPIYVFDTIACKMKRGTLIKRKEAKECAKIQMEMETDVKVKNKLYKRAFSVNDNIVKEVKFMLTNLGVLCIESPNGIESEHYAAELVKNGVGQFVLSSDADALLFGAARTIKKEKGGKLTLYSLDNILKKHEITLEQLIKAGVALGCDFAPKTPRVGVKTVIKKIKENKIEFTDEQKEAIKIFQAIPPKHVNDNSTELKKLDIQEGYKNVYKWLVEEKEFNSDRLYKMFAKVSYKGEKIVANSKEKNGGLSGSRMISNIDKELNELCEGGDINSIIDNLLADNI
jgi:5'-3' exonuclease